MIIEYVKTNHVITVKTHGRCSIPDIYDKLQYGKHTPDRFSALTLKHSNPSATIIIFSTGNVTIMGGSTFWGALYVLNNVKRKLNLDILKIKLTNIVIKFSQKSLNVSNLYTWDQRNCSCDMQLFPSCTYMVPNTSIKANFFNSGKVVVAGCSSDEKVVSVIHQLIEVIRRFHEDKNFDRSNVTIQM